MSEKSKAGYLEMRDKYRKGLETFAEDVYQRNKRVGYQLHWPDERERMARQSKIMREVKAEIDSLKEPVKFGSSGSTGDSKSPSGSNNSSSGARTKSSDTGTSGQYHINPETGRANKCYAKKKACPFGGKDSHYATKDEARDAYEQRMKKTTLPLKHRKK